MDIKEFSKKSGYSIATISRAFGSKGRISPKTKAIILQEAEKHGYQANVFASKLASKKSNTIAFFYPQISENEPDYFVNEILIAVNSSLSRANRLLQIHPLFTQDDQVSYEYLFNSSLEGVIVIAGTDASTSIVQKAKKAKLPYIILGSMKGEDERVVSFSSFKGAFLAGQYFKKSNRKKPLFLGGILDKKKREGFLKGLGNLGKAAKFIDGGYNTDSGYKAIQQIFKKSKPHDCILCATDVLAMGALKAILDYGFKVPEQVAIIGFDNIKISKLSSPALTTVALNHIEAGCKAVEQLLRLIQGEDILRHEISSELIMREST